MSTDSTFWDKNKMKGEDAELVKQAEQTMMAGGFGAVFHTVASILFGTEEVQNWKKKLWVIPVCLVLFLVLMIIDMFASGALTKHGIHPREVSGLAGILWSPFLHQGVSQFISNIIPFSILGAFVLMRENGVHVFFTLSVITTLAAGTAVWIFGKSGSNNCGASLLVFGYFGYLIAYGVYANEVRAALAATIVVIMEGGLIWGMFPATMTEYAFSWEGHVFACLVGVAGGLVDAKYGDQLRDSIFRNPVHHCFGSSPNSKGAGDLPDDFDAMNADDDIMDDDLA